MARCARDLHPAVLRHPLSVIDLISSLISLHHQSTILIICSSRDDFIYHLQSAIDRKDYQHVPELEIDGSQVSPHAFLSPTIHLLATSKRVQLAFTPTLSHLRAYLATLTPEVNIDPSRRLLEHSQNGDINLVISGFLVLHDSRQELSAQGISRTMAIAVEIARLRNMKLIVTECKPGVTLDEDALDPSLEIPWDRIVPLLNGTDLDPSRNRPWNGPTIRIGRVLGRWCRVSDDFEDLFQPRTK